MRCLGNSALGLLLLFVAGVSAGDDPKDKPGPMKSPDGTLVLEIVDGVVIVTNVKEDKSQRFTPPEGKALNARFSPKNYKPKSAKGPLVFWASGTQIGCLNHESKELWRYQFGKQPQDKAVLSFALNKEVQKKRYDLVSLTGGPTPLFLELETGKLILKGQD